MGRSCRYCPPTMSTASDAPLLGACWWARRSPSPIQIKWQGDAHPRGQVAGQVSRRYGPQPPGGGAGSRAWPTTGVWPPTSSPSPPPSLPCDGSSGGLPLPLHCLCSFCGCAMVASVDSSWSSCLSLMSSWGGWLDSPRWRR